MIFAPDSGSIVVSWSPPDPPNGVILYYNIRINNSDNGDLVAFIQEQNVTSIDVALYGNAEGKYTVEVKDVYITRCEYVHWISCSNRVVQHVHVHVYIHVHVHVYIHVHM